MSDWTSFVDAIETHVASLRESGCDMPFFRGHSNSAWPLLCGLGRKPPEEYKKQNLESILYYDFSSLGGGLLGKHADSWDILFAMQHHGLPTRLLDWSTTFAAALYFALRPYLVLRAVPDQAFANFYPCVWVLDPFELNQKAKREPTLVNPYTDLDGSYQDIFIEEGKPLEAKAVAIIPPQHSARQSAQRSVFTLHKDIYKPLEKSATKSLRKFELTDDALQDALSFLSLAGANEFSIYPDLDGLARHLKSEHVWWL